MSGIINLSRNENDKLNVENEIKLRPYPAREIESLRWGWRAKWLKRKLSGRVQEEMGADRQIKDSFWTKNLFLLVKQRYSEHFMSQAKGCDLKWCHWGLWWKTSCGYESFRRSTHRELWIKPFQDHFYEKLNATIEIKIYDILTWHRSRRPFQIIQAQCKHHVNFVLAGDLLIKGHCRHHRYSAVKKIRSVLNHFTRLGLFGIKYLM